MSILGEMPDYDGALSDTWLKLLGTASTELDASKDSRDNGGDATRNGIESPIPVTDDPWSELLRAQGVEVVDLQQNGSLMIHVSFSEQEVEQALQLLQEQ